MNRINFYSHMASLPREPFESLLAFREDRAWTQAQAAAYVGITQGMWCRLENKTAGARPKLARKISRKTGVPVMALLNFGGRRIRPKTGQVTEKTVENVNKTP